MRLSSPERRLNMETRLRPKGLFLTLGYHPGVDEDYHIQCQGVGGMGYLGMIARCDVSDHFPVVSKGMRTNGIWLEDVDEIKVVVVSQFEQLYKPIQYPCLLLVGGPLNKIPLMLREH
ncbi:hypothetical protein VNO77_09077 [Canavalia gladiata]|uniref:Uncharacterized protein n=1 Tax=Canavalia gladiata TaxID=3824 RepID=A0AAN9QX84_CANGL